MKKIIQISKTDSDFEITEEKKLITKISNKDLTLSGKDIYFELFDKYPLDEKIELEIHVDESVKNSNDRRIANEISSVLENIAKDIQKNIISAK